MAYQIEGDDHVMEWMGREPSAEARQAMLDWMPQLSTSPKEVATARLQRDGVPGYVARVPHTEAFVDYTVVEQYKVVLIIDVRTSRLDDLS